MEIMNKLPHKNSLNFWVNLSTFKVYQNIYWVLFVCLMVFNATFNNISWRSVLLVEETGGPGENYRPVQVTDKLYHIMLYSSPWSRFELITSVVIGTDCIGSCKSTFKVYQYIFIGRRILSPNYQLKIIKLICYQQFGS